MSLRQFPILVLTCVSLAGFESGLQCSAKAYVALMAGQRARPLNGTFNNVPVLHSNQPEIVTGPGILVNTAAGAAIAAESNQPLRNAAYTFNGEFGVHMHHKYYPQDQSKLGGHRSRGLMTLALIATNPGTSPITLDFERGSVKNSFEAPYHSNRLMGVKPLGVRPWNTGPGDATAVQLLRGELDRKLPERVVIPAGARRVVVRTVLPARGIANGLLRGRSNGPFTMAVVAAEKSAQDADLLATLQSGLLAPGRIYLNRIDEIHLGRVFSRVAGVALGDAYKAEISHDLNQGPLHVPLTSTKRHHFGTSDVQVNPLATRMIDSALNNIGTYGVRYDVTLNLSGEGPHHLVLSHPVISGRKSFTAFRGSLQIVQDRTLQEVHVGMRSGESLALTDLNLAPGSSKEVKVSLVYPADATPGHLLSVVPVQQLALLHRHKQQQREAQLKFADTKSWKFVPQTAPPPPEAEHVVVKPPQVPPAPVEPASEVPGVAPAVIPVTNPRYGDVSRSQQQWLLQLQGR